MDLERGRKERGGTEEEGAVCEQLALSIVSPLAVLRSLRTKTRNVKDKNRCMMIPDLGVRTF